MSNNKIAHMELKLVLEDCISLSDDQKLKVMTSLSQNYIQSSIIFSKNAQIIESQDLHDDNDRSNHHAFVVGSILFSVLYLEATINEFFINVVEKKNSGSVINDIDRDELTNYWTDDKINRQNILKKYNQALLIMRCPKMNKGVIPYKYIDKLISLRNYLVHYKSEWVEVKEFENVKVTLVDLDRELTELSKFCKNSMYDKAFFPNKYLNYGFTYLAISNCLRFVDEFYSNLGIGDIYKDKIKDLIRKYGV